jgi:hypothetical protein
LYALRNVVSDKGNVFRVLTRTRMPLIPTEYLSCAVYMYRRAQDARNGVGCAGSGFLLVVPSSVEPEVRYLYVVTNRHVVLDGNGVVPRLTTTDGGTETIDLGLEDWVFDRQGDDLAMSYIGPARPPYKVLGVPDSYILTRERSEKFHVGPGDEVFLVGRFREHDGERRNSPSVRFGNVSMMPTEPILHDGNGQYSFLVEARSISGYSGAPVFLHIPPDNWRPKTSERTGLWTHRLLGVDCGHIFRKAPLVNKRTGEILDPDWVVKLDTAMMVVVPAWVLGEWLDKDPLAGPRRDHERRLAEEKAARPTTEPDAPQ